MLKKLILLILVIMAAAVLVAGCVSPVGRDPDGNADRSDTETMTTAINETARYWT
jgi:hypothetical protein